jgi:hypothetical protein
MKVRQAIAVISGHTWSMSSSRRVTPSPAATSACGLPLGAFVADRELIKDVRQVDARDRMDATASCTWRHPTTRG